MCVSEVFSRCSGVTKTRYSAKVSLRRALDLCQADFGHTVIIFHFNRVVKNRSRRPTSCSTTSSKPVLCRPEFKVTRSSFLKMNFCSLCTKGILSNIQSLTLRQSLSEGDGRPATAFACNSILSGKSLSKARKTLRMVDVSLTIFHQLQLQDSNHLRS